MGKIPDLTIPYRTIGVVGGGAWGTALAMAAATAGRQVILWAREAEVVASIATAGENRRFLPGVALPRAIRATAALDEALAADAVLFVVPAQHLRQALADAAPRLAPGIPAVLCAKGIERGSGRLMSEILAEAAPEAEPALLSGPSFARDVARGLPTAVTVAARRLGVAEALQAALGSASFRPYASDDPTGVALGGAAKNVYAIAAGIVEGLKLGESARAALIARSFAELSRLGEALGARRETLTGLSGLGDLVLTATSRASRNFSCGIAIGEGGAAFSGDGAPLAEGVETAPALVLRARSLGLELPVAETVAAILDGRLALNHAASQLMQRPFRTE